MELFELLVAAEQLAVDKLAVAGQLAAGTLAVVLVPGILAVGTLVEPVVLAADTSAVAVAFEPDIPVVAEQLAEPGLAVDKLAVVEQLAAGILAVVLVPGILAVGTLAEPVVLSVEQVGSSLPS